MSNKRVVERNFQRLKTIEKVLNTGKYTSVHKISKEVGGTKMFYTYLSQSGVFKKDSKGRITWGDKIPVSRRLAKTLTDKVTAYSVDYRRRNDPSVPLMPETEKQSESVPEIYKNSDAVVVVSREEPFKVESENPALEYKSSAEEEELIDLRKRYRQKLEDDRVVRMKRDLGEGEPNCTAVQEIKKARAKKIKGTFEFNLGWGFIKLVKR